MFIHTGISAPKIFAKFGWLTQTFCYKKWKSSCQTRVRQIIGLSIGHKKTLSDRFSKMCCVPTLLFRSLGSIHTLGAQNLHVFKFFGSSIFQGRPHYKIRHTLLMNTIS